MNKPFVEIGNNIVESVRSCLAISLTGKTLIRELKGAHPIDVKSDLLSSGVKDLYEQVFGSISVTLPYLHEIAREDNPILGFWPFTTETDLKIAELTNSSSSIALLGVPTLFNLLKRRNVHSDVYLFDRDNYFFDEEITPGFVNCDVVSEVPNAFNNKFDTVIADPPWYLSECCDWLATAERIVKPGGTVIFVLFPERVRETAKSERNTILSLAKEMFVEFSHHEAIVEYETPSFEQVQMIRSGIQPVNWRMAGLIIGRIRNDKKTSNPSMANKYPEEWVERRIGSGRLFIKMDAKATNDRGLLQTADPNSRFLRSPSRRDPYRSRANVISSRGHGLYCSDSASFLQIIEKVNSLSEVKAESRLLDEKSRELFKSVLFDLWPRFIYLGK